MSSKRKSPIYDVKKIPCYEIVGQAANPNVMNSKSYNALIKSILNNGYVMSINCTTNSLYDESKASSVSNYDKICMCVKGSEQDQRSAVGSYSFATEVSDSDIRCLFPYEIIDGSQRASVVRLGTKYFLEDKFIDKKIERWVSGDIPTRPGTEALKYIAWLEDFCLPVCITEGKTEAEKMSATVLLNTSRGTHTLDSITEIVYGLINVAGMSKEWVAENLYLDVESVNRMNQIGGLKTAYNNVDSCDLGWAPENDEKYINNLQGYLNKEAAKYIVDYYKGGRLT